MAEHETKFVFPTIKSNSLIKWLLSRCSKDGQYSKGIISSIYYDTVDWNFLNEKINSDYLKTKFRLRWYQDIDSLQFSSSAFFEKKEKIGSSRRKSRVELPVDDAVKKNVYLNTPYFVDLPNKIYTMGIQPTRAIIPAFQISYIRHRFVDTLTGARLAVDTGIHVPRINPAMVKRMTTSPLKSGVFEYKSDSMNLPDWLHGVTLFGCRRGAFSKYSNCFAHVTGLIE